MKQFFLVATVFLIPIFSLMAQSPGGIGAPTLWLRGTAGTSTTTNNASNTTWTSAGSIAANVTQATAANQPLYRNGSGAAAPLGATLNVFNYNPYLFFDGVNDNLASTTSYNFGASSSSGTGITQLAVVHPNNTAGIVYFEWNGPNAMIKCKSDGPQCLTDGLGNTGTNNQYNTLNNTVPRIQHMIGFDNGLLTNSAGANGFSGYNHIAVTTTASNNNPSGSNADRTNVGCNVNTGEFSNTDIAEIIIFNRNITLAEMLRVNSFLGIKYGITLGGNGSTTNYTNSTGTIVWNSLAAYHNHVIGIARDDNSGLLQKQSHSNDDTLRVYLSTLVATNTTNAGSFSSNNSYVILGGNTGRLCATNASNAEIPTGLTNCTINSRIEREWRVQRSNMAQAFHVDIKLAGCANLSNVSVADLRLLVDDDGNFSNGGTTCFYNGDGTGIVISYANPIITITGISTTHIPDNAFRFITIASVNPATPLPVLIKSFQGKCAIESGQIDFTWTVEDEHNVSHYVLEASSDGMNWSKLIQQNIHSSIVPNANYTVTVSNSALFYQYFRLSSVDNDGSIRVCQPIALNCSSNVLLYPNPTTGIFNIYLPKPEFTTVYIYDGLGKLIEEKLLDLSTKLHTFSLIEQQSGPFYIAIVGEKETLHFKINYID